MLYKVNSKKQHDKVVAEMRQKGFLFPNNASYDFEHAKSLYHGNSILLLHTFYNDITHKKEMQYTTKSVYLSYPQHTRKNYNEEMKG